MSHRRRSSGFNATRKIEMVPIQGDGRMKFRILIALLLPVVCYSNAFGQAGHRLVEGVIEGAAYAVAKPKEWNGVLVLVAHGFRPPDAPLVHGFNPDYQAYRYLLQDGWMVAATSYRRNGVIISDAIKDLDNLRDHINTEFGAPKRILVDGSSMGGIIGTRMAETRFEAYHGILAKGAALRMTAPEESYKLTAKPKIPLLFLSNQDEMDAVRQYAREAENAPCRPVVWEIGRDGHVNINAREHEAALRALDTWAATGEVDRSAEATIPNPPAISSAVFEDGGAYGSITEVSSDFGNINTDIIMKDLEILGIDRRDSFNVIYGNKTVGVLFGTTYSDVPRGKWVGFISWEGVLRIARNFENAAQALGCKTGDRVLITAVPRDN